VLKPEALNSVVQLDIDPDIIGVLFQFIPGELPTVFIHIHTQLSNWTIKLQFPMAIATRMRIE